MNTNSSVWLPPGFTDEAKLELIQGTFAVLVHAWNPGWGAPERAGQYVKSLVTIEASLAAVLSVRPEGGALHDVARADLWAWEVIPVAKQARESLGVITATLGRLAYPASLWVPSAFR